MYENELGEIMYVGRVDAQLSITATVLNWRDETAILGIIWWITVVWFMTMPIRRLSSSINLRKN